MWLYVIISLIRLVIIVLFQFGVFWNPEEITIKKLRDLKLEIFTEATHILWNLW